MQRGLSGFAFLSYYLLTVSYVSTTFCVHLLSFKLASFVCWMPTVSP